MQQNTYSFVKFFGHGRLTIFMATRLLQMLFLARSRTLRLEIFQIEGGIEPLI
jgi:hypothetical protein